MEQKRNKIFLVEDDLSFGAVLKSYLELNDFQVTWISDGAEALPVFTEGCFDLCILDVMLPHIDGFTIGRAIRKMKSNLPIIFLTAKTMKEDILEGFHSGADDYITKPFDSDVLICKIQAILRRGNNVSALEEDDTLRVGKYFFNPQLRTLSLDDQEQKLSPREGELLRLLFLNLNELVPRSVALNQLWGNDDYFSARSMDVYITRLRKYLKGDSRLRIENIHSSGFRLVYE